MTLKMDIANIIRHASREGLPILLFYLCAVVCRAISVFILPELFANSRNSIWLQLCEGIGPTLGALAVMYFFKRKLYCNIMGKSWKRSIACLVLPILLFLLFDKANGIKTSLIFLGCSCYAFLEEVGWRGYLTGEFAGLNQFKRILTITAFWFFWHLNFPLGINGLVFFAILLLSSWGLDQLAHDTHSLILCACLHGIFNLFKHNNGLLNNQVTISLLVISIISWFVVWYCPFNKNGNPSKSNSLKDRN